MFKALKIIARLRGLRGTVFDIFGRTEERKMERQLVRDYENMLAEFHKSLTGEKLFSAIALASTPSEIRGFGHVKEKSIETSLKKSIALLQDYHSHDKDVAAAE